MWNVRMRHLGLDVFVGHALLKRSDVLAAFQQAAGATKTLASVAQPLRMANRVRPHSLADSCRCSVRRIAF